MPEWAQDRKLRVATAVAVLLSGLGGGGVWWAKESVEEKRDSLTMMRAEIRRAVEKLAMLLHAKRSNGRTAIRSESLTARTSSCE